MSTTNLHAVPLGLGKEGKGGGGQSEDKNRQGKDMQLQQHHNIQHMCTQQEHAMLVTRPGQLALPYPLLVL